MTNNFVILPAYASLFYSDKTFHIISGGRSSGKSVNCAAYLLIKLLGDEPNRSVIARYTAKSLTNSLYQDILDLITLWNVRDYLTISGDQIINKRNGNMLITHAMKISDGTQTAKSKGIAGANILFLDESTEIPDEESFLKLADSFRMKDRQIRIILAFNPVSKAHWIFKRFYTPDGKPKPQLLRNHNFIHTTYHDNIPNINPEKIKEWENAKFEDPEYYRHHILGEWKSIGDGQIYTNWKFAYEPDPEAEELYGLDFGFSSDPSVLVRILKRGKRIWVEELIYETGLTNEDLASRMRHAGVKENSVIYADSADPKSIEELRRLGFRFIRPAIKGPDSVNAGINKIRGMEVHCHPESKNLMEEYQMYSYRTGTDKPVDKWNHAMDAIRYALSTYKDGPVIAFPTTRSKMFL